MAQAPLEILAILFVLACLTLGGATLVEAGPRFTRRGTLGRGVWLSLAGGTALLFLLLLALLLAGALAAGGPPRRRSANTASATSSARRSRCALAMSSITRS